MRILHTSDWHLGRSFHGLSLHDISEKFLLELVETVKEKNIDAVLVSGDVYDQAQPRTETIELLSAALEELSELGCAVVLSSGNHDSAARLGFASKLLARQRVFFQTEVEQSHEPVLLEKGGVSVAIFAAPYLEPRSMGRRLGVAPTHRDVLEHTFNTARQRKEELPQDTVNIAMAHCFASGSQPTESERNIAVGGIETVDFQVFRDFDYVALGHIHGKQKLTDTIRYSGSPLAFSFSEENHRKGAWLLDVEAEGIVEISEVIWKNKLSLKTLRGTLAELCTEKTYTPFEQSICRIYITDDMRPLGALEKLRERFETVAELYFDPSHPAQRDTRAYAQRVSQTMNTEEVCTDFFGHVRGSELTPDEVTYVHDVCMAVEAEEVSA